MTRLLVAAALLAGCHRAPHDQDDRSPREEDCEFVRGLLAPNDGFDPSANAPGNTGSAAVVIFDPKVVHALALHAFLDAEVAAAAKIVAVAKSPTEDPDNNDYLVGVAKLHALCPYR